MKRRNAFNPCERSERREQGGQAKREFMRLHERAGPQLCHVLFARTITRAG